MPIFYFNHFVCDPLYFCVNFILFTYKLILLYYLLYFCTIFCTIYFILSLVIFSLKSFCLVFCNLVFTVVWLSIFSEFNQFLFLFLIMHFLLVLHLFFIYLMSVGGYLIFECYITVSLCFEKFWEWGRIFIRWIVWVISLNFIFIGVFCCSLSVFSVC